MGAYDSPGRVDRLPGGIDVSFGSSMTAPGSAPPYPVVDIPGTSAASALVTPYGSGYQNADRVSVSPDDTQVPSQTDLYAGQDVNPIGGVTGAAVGYSGAGTGSVAGPHHPNAGTGI